MGVIIPPVMSQRSTIAAFLLMLPALFGVLPLSAQITEIRWENGEMIACSRSGLQGFPSRVAPMQGTNTFLSAR